MDDILTPVAPLAGPASSEAERSPAHQQLEHRFRYSMRAGQVSPLFHLVLRYKQEQLACKPRT